MPVKYDFFLTPQPKDKQQKVRYHARTVVDNTLTNKDIATPLSISLCRETMASVRTRTRMWHSNPLVMNEYATSNKVKQEKQSSIRKGLKL